jgi:hypothetical protein
MVNQFVKNNLQTICTDPRPHVVKQKVLSLKNSGAYPDIKPEEIFLLILSSTGLCFFWCLVCYCAYERYKKIADQHKVQNE